MITFWKILIYFSSCGIIIRREKVVRDREIPFWHIPTMKLYNGIVSKRNVFWNHWMKLVNIQNENICICCQFLIYCVVISYNCTTGCYLRVPRDLSIQSSWIHTDFSCVNGLLFLPCIDFNSFSVSFQVSMSSNKTFYFKIKKLENYMVCCNDLWRMRQA
jgi:hypothetical protein